MPTVNQVYAGDIYQIKLTFHPSRSPDVIGRQLSQLIYSGTIRNPQLDSAIKRLHDRFTCYCTYYPFGPWAPGLVVTNEMRALTEQYLPLNEITAAFKHFYSSALSIPPVNGLETFWRSATWLDVLQRLEPVCPSANPGLLLDRLSREETYRSRFLFALCIPHHHGGSFRRYPGQLSFLKEWLGKQTNSAGTIRILDAACGTGEGTYDLVRITQLIGIPPERRLIHGCSLDPLELFTAAYGYFPHDRSREERFRAVTVPILAGHGSEGVQFFRDDVTLPPRNRGIPYDVIVCNGLIGGPALHEREAIERTVRSLALRLKTGGMLLMANRFHGGWKKEVPQPFLEEILKLNGFEIQIIIDGIAAVKK